MRFEMVQCDECCAEELTDDAAGWTLSDLPGDFCPACADARALEAEHDLSVAEGSC